MRVAAIGVGNLGLALIKNAAKNVEIMPSGGGRYCNIVCK